MTKSSHSSCENICKEIHDCFCGKLYNLKHLVQALAGEKTQLECRKIREKYKEMYGEDLIDLLQNTHVRDSEKKIDQQRVISSSNSTCRALSLLMLNPHERDATIAKEALSQQNGHINYKALIEIYAGRKSSHFFLIEQAYHSIFRRQMDQDIINIEPPHPYQKLLMALSATQKAHSAEISEHIAKCDAQRLFQTGEGRSGAIDEAVVLEILSKRSISQTKLTFSMYKHIYGHSYVKSLKNKYYGEFEDALKAVVKFITDPPKCYAKAIQESMKGGTSEKGELERVMVSRAELDMKEIGSVYKKKYGMELRDAISERVPAGDYRDFFIVLATKS